MYDYYEPGSIKKAIDYFMGFFLLFSFVDLRPHIIFLSSALYPSRHMASFLPRFHSHPASCVEQPGPHGHLSRLFYKQDIHRPASRLKHCTSREWPSVDLSHWPSPSSNFNRQVGRSDVTRADPLHLESRYVPTALGDVLMRGPSSLGLGFMQRPCLNCFASVS